MKKAFNKWKQFAEKVGITQINFVFSLLFYLIFLPIGIISNFFLDFLKVRSFPEWEDVTQTYNTMPKLKNQ